MLLPCNVIIREVDGQVAVDSMDPGLMASMTGEASIEPVANTARELINEALQRIAA